MLTILIAARDAAATIERAVRSCLEERLPIILIDDHCTDDTVARALAAGGEALRVIGAPDPGGVARARQAGLDAVQTEYAAWLDADDAWIPGRAARLLALLRDGADVAVDAIELYDGPSEAHLRTLTVPAFLAKERRPLRLFERNYLPGDTQVAFRTAVFRRVGGYDPALCGPESFDLLLRALMDGATFGYCPQPGYRMYAYPGSVSRDLGRQRAALQAALRKHDYRRVRDACLRHGYDPRTTDWILVSMALFRGEPEAALHVLASLKPAGGARASILEPDGPCPRPEAWRHAFFHGTALLLADGDVDAAARDLQHAERDLATPEGANNLGVAVSRRGETAAARHLFRTALQRFPGYVDARRNLEHARPSHITTHPLRQRPSRSEYGSG